MGWKLDLLANLELCRPDLLASMKENGTLEEAWRCRMKFALCCLAVASLLIPLRSFAESSGAYPPKEYNVHVYQEKKNTFEDSFKKGFEEGQAEKNRLAEEKRIQEKLGPGYVVIVDKSGQTHIIKKDE